MLFTFKKKEQITVNKYLKTRASFLSMVQKDTFLHPLPAHPPSPFKKYNEKALYYLYIYSQNEICSNNESTCVSNLPTANINT